MDADLLARSRDLLAVAEAAAAEVTAYLCEAARTEMGRDYKRDAHDIVTVHDLRCEEIATAILRDRVPGCRIVGEEGGERPSAGDQDVTFYVDPIDGTANFAAGLPFFCVSIGVTIGDDLVAGVISAPLLGDVFTADAQGAWVNGTPLVSGCHAQEHDALILTNFPSTRDLAGDRETSLTQYAEIVEAYSVVRRLGSAALELAYVAAGWADATCATRISSWDVAAGMLMVRNAGGAVTFFRGGGPDDIIPAHASPAYLAVGAGGSVPTLARIMDDVEDARRAGRNPV